MRKVVHTFIVLCLLTSTALANITVFRCLDEGSLCLSKTCCKTVEKEASCCSDHVKKVIVNDECCDEVEIITDNVFTDAGKNKKDKDSNQDLEDFITNSLLSIKLLNTDLIRGPPAAGIENLSYKSPLYILNCSFLC